jgi:hypothetical protein
MARVPGSRYAVFLAVLLVARSGVAQSTASASATAESLFREAKELVAAQRYAEACPKFQASFALEEALGTLLNLANCLELGGKTASAWAEFLRAGALARSAEAWDREQVARERAQALEPRLMRLQIVVPTEVQVPGLEIQRDKQRVDTAAWGSAIPVDPGKYVISVQAPGKEAYEAEVELVSEGATVQFEVVPLKDKAAEPVVVPPPAAPSTSPAPLQPAAPPQHDAGTSSSQATFGLVVGSVGVAGLAAGTVFGALAKGHWDDAKDEGCAAGRCPTSAGQQASNDANDMALFGTVGLIAGGTLLVTGAVLYFTAPSSDDTAFGSSHTASTWFFDGVLSKNNAALKVGGKF